MKEINLEELKLLQLEILYKIDIFCKKNNIKYFLSAGSLIGAVRHGGYIPWDDDIDIMMLRTDYDKFIQSFNGYYEYLVVDAPELNWNYYAPYANIFDNRTILDEGYNGHRGQNIGVKIDLFPYDNLPESDIIYKITQWIVLRLNSLLGLKRSLMPFKKLSIKKQIGKMLFCWLPYSIIQRFIHTIAVSNMHSVNSDVFLRTFDITKLMRAPKELFDTAIYMKFENNMFPVPVGYDEFLRIRFGNYMQLPPMEQRIAHHNFKVYWKEDFSI